MFSFELIVHDTLHQATLSHTCISNDNKLEKVILSGQGSVIEHLILELVHLLYLLLTVHFI